MNQIKSGNVPKNDNFNPEELAEPEMENILAVFR